MTTPEIPDAPRCAAQCSEPPGYWHTHTCDRPAKAQRDGHPVCGIHARAKWTKR